MWIIEQFPLESDQEDPGWNSSSPFTYILRKIHTYTSLIREMNNWSLSETTIPNLSKSPSLLLIWCVFFVANDNMRKLESLLLTDDPSPEYRLMFKIKFETGSQHFEDLIHLLTQIEHEIAIENNSNPFSDSSDFNNFKKMVINEFGRSEGVKRLVKRVHEFNEGVDKLEDFLKSRNQISNNKEQDEKDDKHDKKGKNKEKSLFNIKNDYLCKENNKLDNENNNLESDKLDKDNNYLKNNNNQLKNKNGNLHNEKKNSFNNLFEWLDIFLEKQWESFRIEKRKENENQKGRAKELRKEGFSKDESENKYEDEVEIIV